MNRQCHKSRGKLPDKGSFFVPKKEGKNKFFGRKMKNVIGNLKRKKVSDVYI